MSKFEMTKVINFFTYKYKGDWDSIYNAIQRKEPIQINELEDFYKVDGEVSYLSIIDERYPDNYKQIYMPPLTLYYAGDINPLNETNILSLWGDIDEDNLKKLILTNRTFALKATKENIAIAQKFASNNLRFILVDYKNYNSELVKQLAHYPHITYITEIPNNSNNVYEQNASRMLLGISNKSVFFNANDAEFSLYKNISNFEKRNMKVIGQSNPEYLSFAKRFLTNN